MQKIKENFRRINKKEAKASFYIVENLCYCYIKGVWGVAPSRLMGGRVDYNIKCNTKNMDIILTFV